MRKLYTDFAKYYDKIYARKDYTKEVDFIDTVLKRNGLAGGSVLDVACGTGNHDVQLVKRGYRITGVDLSKDMLKIARKKVPDAKYVQGDMRSFKLHTQYDAVLCMFTVMNYNLRISDMVATLRNLKRHVKDEGVLIFDTRPPAQRMTRGEILDSRTAVLYEARDKGKTEELMIYWLLKDGKETKVVEDAHELRYYDSPSILRAIDSAGLEGKLYHSFSFRKRKGRFVFVCKKN